MKKILAVFVALCGIVFVSPAHAQLRVDVNKGKIEPVPIVLVGSYFWSGLLEWLVATPGSAGCISEHDIDLMIVVDTAGAAVEAVTSQLAMRVGR